MGRKTHGETTWINGVSYRSPEYMAWHSMKKRCYNSNDQGYVNYGGRNIVVDPRWNKFENFLEDMGRRPTDDHTLERIDNNGNYTKDNCCWATHTEQNRNRRCNKLKQKDIEDIRRLYNNGHTQTFIASIFEVSRKNIFDIVHYRRWK